jgi:ADP-ribosylglycohydrolase
MRVAPIGAAFSWQANSKLIDAAHQDAIITHNNVEAIGASIAVAKAVSFLVQFPEATVEALVAHILPTSAALSEHIHYAFWDGWRLLSIPDVDRGNAVFTVSTALYSVFQNFDSFPNAVEHAIREGGDTDTRAAIVGAIMGAKVGYEGIPDEWTKNVLQSDRLCKLDEKLLRLRYNGRI